MTRDDVDRYPVPAACTLPTAEVPLRIAEFEDLFAAVRMVRRPAPTLLLLTLTPAAGRAEAVRDLAAREATCCSFFRFLVRDEGDAVVLEIGVPDAHIEVLDAISRRAADAAGRP